MRTTILAMRVCWPHFERRDPLRRVAQLCRDGCLALGRVAFGRGAADPGGRVCAQLMVNAIGRA